MSLEEKLDRIRSSPKLQNQQQTALVLSAVEETLRNDAQSASSLTPTAYFAALLSLLSQHISSARGIVNKDIAYAVVYLLDLVTPHVPPALLREKFSQILSSLAPALTHHDADAPLLRSSIGCLESLLKVQTGAAWQLSQAQVSPRRAVAGLLSIAADHRPKVRKRAQEAIANVLQSPPPSPSLDHPAADMCAESALRTLQDLVKAAEKGKKASKKDAAQQNPTLIHALQLVKTVANASGGWPSKKIDALCDLLFNVSRSSNEFLTMAAFEVFEIIFTNIAEDSVASAKLPHLLEVIEQLQPSLSDTQLLPPWIAVISRAYDVSSQVSADDTFHSLPTLFSKISSFLSSSSHNIRVSASECLISLLANCLPTSVILEPSVYDEKTLEKLASKISDLLDVKYQGAWMEVFSVLGAALDAFHFRSSSLLANVVKTVGDLRDRESFTGKAEADAVLSRAIHAAGPCAVLEVLPLNLLKPGPNRPGRAWLLPLIRDSVSNTNLSHFQAEFVPLSETLYQRVLSHGQNDKTTEIKIFETLVHQVWSCLPGYCDLPLDLVEAFGQSFAEMLANLLYQQPELRTDLCRALQTLVDSNKAVMEAPEEDDLMRLARVSKTDAERNIKHLAGLAGDLLAVLFNVYSQTLPHNRGVLLQCINAYLSITPEKELMETFTKVADMLEKALQETKASKQEGEKSKQKSSADKMPPTSHTLMDLLITLSIHLPRSSYTKLFSIASEMIGKDDDVQLQKKAYKLIPRLAESTVGQQALKERNGELQRLLLASGDKVAPPSRRDRLAAIEKVVEHLPDEDLAFIASVLPEVVIATKEVNEKARVLSFDLLVTMGRRMKDGGTIVMSSVPHMDSSAPNTAASLEEYLTMVSAGLAGSTPHAISAAVTACTRILYEFKDDFAPEVIDGLVETMDLFLQSKNREVVRSVLGFVKVCVISLPDKTVRSRLPNMMKSLMMWSHEHKGQLKAKVKHIVERMIRRFGVEEIEKACPEEDKKLITNIRKTKERKKRKKDARDADDVADTRPSQQLRKGKFESEFDEAIYGSSDDESVVSGSDEEEGGVRLDKTSGRKGGKGSRAQTYIVEDEDEPLDLLDKRALGRISSIRPVPARQIKKTKAQTNMDGKLIFTESSGRKGRKHVADGDDDNDDEMLDDANAADDSVNAYVEAVSGRDAARKGQRGKLKFTNRPQRGAEADDDDMDVDEAELKAAAQKAKQGMRSGQGTPKKNGAAGPRSPGSGMKVAKKQRRGLGEPKRRDKQFVSSGRVGKERRGVR